VLLRGRQLVFWIEEAYTQKTRPKTLAFIREYLQRINSSSSGKARAA
jgi:hypothetical protein